MIGSDGVEGSKSSTNFKRSNFRMPSILSLLHSLIRCGRGDREREEAEADTIKKTLGKDARLH